VRRHRPIQSSTGGPIGRWGRGEGGALQREFCFSAQSETSLEGGHVSGQEGIQLTSNCKGRPFRDRDSESGSRRAKMTHKNREKLRNFMFWSDGRPLLRAEGLSVA
jgi:hypothetical protein